LTRASAHYKEMMMTTMKQQPEQRLRVARGRTVNHDGQDYTEGATAPAGLTADEVKWLTETGFLADADDPMFSPQQDPGAPSGFARRGTVQGPDFYGTGQSGPGGVFERVEDNSSPVRVR